LDRNEFEKHLEVVTYAIRTENMLNAEGIAAKAVLLLDCVNNQVMSNMNLRVLRHLYRSHIHMAKNNSYTSIVQPYFECCAQF